MSRPFGKGYGHHFDVWLNVGMNAGLCAFTTVQAMQYIYVRRYEIYRWSYTTSTTTTSTENENLEA